MRQQYKLNRLQCCHVNVSTFRFVTVFLCSGVFHFPAVTIIKVLPKYEIYAFYNYVTNIIIFNYL